MCGVDPKTGYAVSIAGVTLFTMLSLCSVVLPGWAMRYYTTAGGGGEEEEETQQTEYAGLFWVCYNGSLATQSCVPGDPFDHSALEMTTKFLVLVGSGFQLAGVVLGLCHLCGPCRCHYGDAWRRHSSVVDVLAIGGGLIFFVGCLCAVGFVMESDESEDYTFGPSLFLALASSTLVINFGCLVFIYNRRPDDDPVFV
ncbi:uncharacterized protein LOC143297723 [Babylonia areolata]|uniref:uncharacterized protein LOC143297723 n=1 Tax=Babylonia areolata TaxID=304850 RepID=UPI003FD6529B